MFRHSLDRNGSLDYVAESLRHTSQCVAEQNLVIGQHHLPGLFALGIVEPVPNGGVLPGGPILAHQRAESGVSADSERVEENPALVLKRLDFTLSQFENLFRRHGGGSVEFQAVGVIVVPVRQPPDAGQAVGILRG